MKTVYVAPQPSIHIYRYDAPHKPFIILSAQPVGNGRLLDYTFSETVQDLTGRFSFSIAGSDASLFDRIAPLNIIKIFEGGTAAVFTGVIKKRRITCAMTASGVKRTLTFTGTSITSLIAEFQLILDVKFLQDLDIQDSDTLNTKLKIEKLISAKPLPIADFLRITWEAYLEYTGIAGKPKSGKKAASNTAVYDIIRNFMGDSFFAVGSGEALPIPIANSFFNQDINTVLQIWQTILSAPVYEIFSYADDASGKTAVAVRQAPFDAQDWKQLAVYPIHAHLLVDYALQVSDEEVYTAFLGYLEGSELSADQYVIIDETDANKQGESIIKKDAKKFGLYGLKLCQIAFRGYNTDKQGPEKTANAMRKMGERLKNWFSRLDELYSGSVTLINTYGQSGGKRPRCGQKARFLGGEFYIQGVEHHWSYGAAATMTLSLIRGGQYDTQGNFIKMLEHIGTSGIELKE